MKSNEFDVVVIGDGPAGIEGALLAAARGWSVALISASAIGGRATKSSLLPSKVWLQLATRYAELKDMQRAGLRVETPAFDMELVREQVARQREAATVRYRKRLEEAGVHIVQGRGYLTGPHAIEVVSEQGASSRLGAKKVLLATGSGPSFFPELRPNKDRIIAPRLSPSLPELPPSLIMAGGGVTGSEYAWALAALGSRVTILHGTMHLLPRIDPEIAAAFEDWLSTHFGVEIHHNSGVVSMKQVDDRVQARTFSDEVYEADYGFVAIGRKADLGFYEPGNLHLDVGSEGHLLVNQFCQTNQLHIYAAGDLTGVPMMANRAQMQARVAVAHMAEGDASTLRQRPVVEAVYTALPVAQIGDMQPDPEADFVVRTYDRLLKAHIAGHTQGLLKVKVDRKTGLIRGASAFGAHAVDIMAAFQLALHHDVPWRRMREVPMPHPSIAELISTLY